MAIGFPPRHKTVYALSGLRPEQFLVLAIETVVRLGWAIHYLSNTGIVATSSPSGAQVSIKIVEGVARLHSGSMGGGLIDRGKNKNNLAQFIATLNQLRETIPSEYLAARYQELIPFLPPAEADTLLNPPKEQSQFADLVAIFKPARDYFVTPIILNLNILLFLLMGLSGVSLQEPDSNSLLAWGANFGPLTQGGEWWRLVTSCFLHIGVIHLLMNMYAFLLIGSQLEPRLGRLRFLAAYIVTGIAASGTSLWWHGQTISAGASGAIFGMYGVFLAMLITDVVEGSNRKQLFASILFFVVYNLLGGLKAGIDNAAHIGGLITGFIIGYGYVPWLRKPQPEIVEAEALQETEDYY